MREDITCINAFLYIFYVKKHENFN
jgi:hypothetical protein